MAENALPATETDHTLLRELEALAEKISVRAWAFDGSPTGEAYQNVGAMLDGLLRAHPAAARASDATPPVEALADRWTACHSTGRHTDHCDATHLSRALVEHVDRVRTEVLHAVDTALHERGLFDAAAAVRAIYPPGVETDR